MEYGKSYMGDAPFAFISYAAKDAARVQPIIETMQKAQYRVWYDEGITPGTQWDERIAARVSACSCVVAMLSQAYFDSENCIDELKYSRDLEKPLLLLCLEDVSLMGSMALRLGRHPKIEYKETSDEEALIGALNQIAILNPCNESFSGQKTSETETATGSKKRKTAVALIAAGLAGLAAVIGLGLGNTDSDIPEPTPTAVVYPIVEVVNNDLLTATVVDIEKDAEQYTMQMKIQNKSTEKLFYSMENTYLDSALCDMDIWGELAGEESAVIPFSWERSELELYDLLNRRDDITIIEGDLMYSLQPEQGFHSAAVTYYPLGENRADKLDVVDDLNRQQEASGIGDIAAETNMLSVVTGKHWHGEDNSLNLELYLQNRSDYDQTVVINLDGINGIYTEERFEFTVKAGCVHRAVMTSTRGSLFEEGEQIVYSGTLEMNSEDGSYFVSERFGLFFY